MEKKIIYALILIVAVIVSGYVLFGNINKKPASVTIILPFLPDVEFLPVYNAATQGFYADEGLDIKIEHTANGSFDAIKQVASGAADFSYSVSSDSLILARSEEIPVVAIYQTEHADMFGILTKKTTEELTPQWLIGKTISMPGPGSPPDIVLKAILKNSGIDEKQVKVNYVGGELISSLLSGKVDATAGHTLFEEILKSINVPFSSIYAKDYGANFPTGITIATEDTISNKKDLVRKFLRATNRGLKYAIDNPGLSVDAYIEKFNPEGASNKTVELNAWNRWINEIIKPNEYSLGYIDKDQWETANNVLADLKIISEKIDISKTYTTEFIPK